jgi:hypothetical protein
MGRRGGDDLDHDLLRLLDPKGAAAFPAGYESGITTYFKGLAKATRTGTRS